MTPTDAAYDFALSLVVFNVDRNDSASSDNPRIRLRHLREGRMTRLVLTVAVLVAATVSGSAQGASDRWLRQVRTILRETGAVLERRGYELTHDVQTGSLRDGQAETFTLILESRVQPYAIVGVCDTDCSDLDLSVSDMYGDQIVEDTQPDDQPLLMFQVSSRTRYRVKVMMASCSTSPCFYGVGIFGR